MLIEVKDVKPVRVSPPTPQAVTKRIAALERKAALLEERAAELRSAAQQQELAAQATATTVERVQLAKRAAAQEANASRSAAARAELKKLESEDARQLREATRAERAAHATMEEAWSDAGVSWIQRDPEEGAVKAAQARWYEAWRTLQMLQSELRRRHDNRAALRMKASGGRNRRVPAAPKVLPKLKAAENTRRRAAAAEKQAHSALQAAEELQTKRDAGIDPQAVRWEWRLESGLVLRSEVPPQHGSVVGLGAADGGLTYWAVGARLFRTDDSDLVSEDVAALVAESDNRRRIRLEKAHAFASLSAEPQKGTRRVAIPQDVKLLVWRRDQGRCADCGSQQELEYDHVIPLAMGGSNTDRNLQLLCAVCNRRKGASLG